MFASATIVIGPHGAGLANLVFCRPGTVVVEIGWDSAKVMAMDPMYYRLADALGLEYRLLVGKGSYSGPISVAPEAVLAKIPSSDVRAIRKVAAGPGASAKYPYKMTKVAWGAHATCSDRQKSLQTVARAGKWRVVLSTNYNSNYMGFLPSVIAHWKVRLQPAPRSKFCQWFLCSIV